MSKPLSYRLFVYGSLRQGFHNPAYTYICDYFHLIAPAKVKGLLYDLGDYPAAVPTDSEQYIVGELYELNQEDEYGWAMAQLDDYEGIHDSSDGTPLYRRDITTVFVGDTTSQAWIYWYNRNAGDYPLIESGDVLQYLQQKHNP